MAEQIIPDINYFIAEVKHETQLDFFNQRIAVANHLFQLSPLRMANIHLEDWYKTYWAMVNFSRNLATESEQDKIAYKNVLAAMNNENNPIRRQYLAMILLLLGKPRDFSKFVDYNLWSPQLREDFDMYARWNNFLNDNLTLLEKSVIRRNFIIAQYLREKFSDFISSYKQMVFDEKTCPRIAPEDYQIYFCWLQGEKNLPPVVRCCYNSLKMNAGRYKICFIDENNFSDYITLPEHVLKKFKDGVITKTHFSDILRFNLLEKYGGLWLDATILVTEPLENHKNLLELPYFTQKFCQDKVIDSSFNTHITYGRWASFIQGTPLLHNPLAVFAKELFNLYWKDADSLIEYLLVDFAMDMAYDTIPFVREEIDAVPVNNVYLYSMQDYLTEDYSNFPYDEIIKKTFLHKLSWKIDFDENSNHTVFKEIQRRYK